MRLISQSTQTSPLAPIAASLVAAGGAIRDGATRIAHPRLDGDAWRAQFDAAIARTGEVWKQPWNAVSDAQAALAQLEPSESVLAARKQLDSAVSYAFRGFSYIDNVLHYLPADLTIDVAQIALDRIADAGMRIGVAIEDAGRAIAQLADATPPPAN